MKLEYQTYECAVGWWRGYVNTAEECTCHQCSGDSASCRHHYSHESASGRGVKYVKEQACLH